MSESLRQHPLSAAFPAMSAQELSDLSDDIALHGLRVPVVTLGGQVLDGWHRYTACQLAGVAPIAVEYDGDDPAAQYAFDQLIWSRLSKEWQDSAVDRLDVCTPFKWQTSNVLSAMACAKGGCGTDDVKFYVTRDGKVGVDVTEKGNCTHAFEEGFVPTDILCSR